MTLTLINHALLFAATALALAGGCLILRIINRGKDKNYFYPDKPSDIKRHAIAQACLLVAFLLLKVNDWILLL